MKAYIARAVWNIESYSDTVDDICITNLRARTPFIGGLLAGLGFLRTLPIDLLRLAKTLRGLDVSVVNLHFPGLNCCAFFLLRLLGLYRGKIVLSFHGSDVSIVKNSRRIERKVWTMAIRNADCVTACSAALGAELEAIVPGLPIRVVHNGVNVDLFRRAPRIVPAIPTILNVAHFDSRKGQDVLIEAFAKLLRLGLTAKLIIVGGAGPALDLIRSRISELHLESNVELRVDVPHAEIPAIMRSVTLFALASRSEAFGIVLLEAGAAGLPVVATRVGGVPEFLKDGVNARLVDAEDAEQLAAALAELITNPERAAAMAARWHNSVIKEWDWKYRCDAYQRLLVAS